MKKLLCYLFVLGCSGILIAGANAPFNDPTLLQITPSNPDLPSPSESANPQLSLGQFKPKPEPEPEPTPTPDPPTLQDRWLRHRIESGDTLSRIFAGYGISSQTLHKILSSTPYSKELAAVYAGREIELLVSASGELEQLRYRPNNLDSFEVSRTEAGFQTTKSSKELERRTAHANGLIRSSLYLDAKAAGLNDKLIMQMAKIFAWDIDFAQDIRKGDEFTVIFEKRYLDGQFYGAGNILAAEFINQGKSHTVVRFTNDEGVAAYYTPEGHSLRKAFLRNPVQYARISSHFNLHRRHPVLNRIRAHKGVDYAAPTGTPVRATGEGRVVFRGNQGGYGRVVVVQHGKKYSTLYAHLSRFGKAARGSRVKQGQIIGYVGMSGLATGPHLHYEFRINGEHRNPLTVKLPNTLPIDDDSLEIFKASTAPLLSQLDLYRTTLLAQADFKQRVQTQ